MKAKLKTTLKTLMVPVAAAALLLVSQASAHAFCACCANDGEWYQRTSTVTAHERSELGRVRLSNVAKTYMGAANEDTVTGIDNPAESYTLTQTRDGNRWRLAFRDAQGRTGTLTLNLPGAATHFGADIRDGQGPQGLGPLLYKEWRFMGTATGTGIFQRAATRPLRFRLILQGRGNNCLDAENYKNWQLHITGPRADFAFYGALQ
jgi:hypothetical protein